MSNLRFLFIDQLDAKITSLQDCDKKNDVILFCECLQELTVVKHHKKKLVFLLSAMRHFANDLKKQNFKVEYITLDDKKNSHDLIEEWLKALKKFNLSSLIMTSPSEYRQLQMLKKFCKQQKNIDVDIRPDERFLCDIQEFKEWAKDKKQLRMEFFYRNMRNKHQILMEKNQPIGGKWNYDKQNRKFPKTNNHIPAPFQKRCDKITKDVMALVENHFPDHFGDIKPFHFAVNRKQALEALSLFIEQRLAKFGDFQDAMLENEPWLFHSHLSFYLNCGLLNPLECIKAAEKAYHSKKAPINSVEGFIRQILGWREFIRGIYWLQMPDYETCNFLDAKNSLPEFYWTGKTQMHCLKQCIQETQKNAYAHHIQRLMVLGNFALLTGINPKQVNEWYWIVYADAYQWVELPNVTGMILFADGGFLGSKPYAASGAYINKMSDYCKSCNYKVQQKNGPSACPFNYLYWNFLIKNKNHLKNNQRLSMIYKSLEKMTKDKIAAIKSDAKTFLDKLF